MIAKTGRRRGRPSEKEAYKDLLWVNVAGSDAGMDGGSSKPLVVAF